MKRKVVSVTMLTLLLTSMLTLAFNIQAVRASGTIYIKADGSIEGTTHIVTLDNVTYTFTDNIYDEIVVERDNIVVDGAGCTVQGTGSGTGIDLSGRKNVTIKNMEIKEFGYGISIYGYFYGFPSNNSVYENNITNNRWGIKLYESSNNAISDNNITNNGDGIFLYKSSNNSIWGNNITANNGYGIWVDESYPNNSVCGNNIIANGEYGIILDYSPNNIISRNNIANNYYGIVLGYWCPNNIIYYNNFVDNSEQVRSDGSTNVWDDGYPSGGNYWSDHVTVDDYSGINQDELGSDGIVDEPYVIDDYNRDNYPLVEPWSPLPRTIGELKTEIEKCWSEGEIDNQGIVKSLIAKLNVAQKLVDKGKIEEAKSILEDDFIPQVQNLSGIHITPEAADILIQSAEYILSHL